MKIIRSDLRLVIGMICGIGIFITGLLGLVDVLNMRIVNNIMIFVADRIHNFESALIECLI